MLTKQRNESNHNNLELSSEEDSKSILSELNITSSGIYVSWSVENSDDNLLCRLSISKGNFNLIERN